MLVISAINSPKDLQDETLRKRALKGHGGRSCEFVAIFDGQEAGLLSYEDWRENGFGFIYEIYVLSLFRRLGIGDALLEHGELYALQLGCDLVQIKPYALDREPTTDQLVDWYRRAGYLTTKKSTDLLEKQVGKSDAL